MTSREHHTCPAEIQQHLTDIFGVNIFGMPLIRIVWGQNERLTIATHSGYREIPKTDKPCWVLEAWRGPECFGTPEMYYEEMGDPETGLALLGEYPEFGAYIEITPLMTKHYDGKELKIIPMPLEWQFIEPMAGLIIASMRMSAEERRLAKIAVDERNKADEVERIADRLEDSHFAFGNSEVMSFGRQGNRNTAMKQRMERIEQEWIRQGFHKKAPRKGFFQVN